MTDKVLYSELLPAEFRERIGQCPIAYLPLGTLEWHGPHLPLGADSIQAEEFFKLLAARMGGIVMPPLFVGPDRRSSVDDMEYYGMDIYTGGVKPYQTQQFDGSCYWIPNDLFDTLLLGIAAQVKRAGFKVLAAHGHGPSVTRFMALGNRIKSKYGLLCLSFWLGHDKLRMLQNDHAAANETSMVMAVRPDLVDMRRIIPECAEFEQPYGIGGRDPRVHASVEYGQDIIEYTIELAEKALHKLLEQADT